MESSSTRYSGAWRSSLLFPAVPDLNPHTSHTHDAHHQDGFLKSIPALLEGYMPAFAGLPLFFLRLATDVDWESERECFETLAREIG